MAGLQSISSEMNTVILRPDHTYTAELAGTSGGRAQAHAGPYGYHTLPNSSGIAWQETTIGRQKNVRRPAQFTIGFENELFE